MLYTEAVHRLQALGAELHAAPGQPRRKFELAQMRTLVAALGDPQQQFPSVLIAGTNGKGSTASTLAAILAASGLRTGLYTSPHLVRVNERIQILAPAPGTAQEVPRFRIPDTRITDTLIPDDDFSRHLEAVIHVAERLVSEGGLPGPPSFFETVTAMAFLHFAEAKVDIAVLEVGLGGRLDATNIVEPALSIITDISLDHTEWLGHTIAEIAHEKAGILRPNGILVTLPQHPEANQAIGETAVSLNVRAINATAALPFDTHAVTNTRNRYPLDIVTGKDDGLHIEVDSPLAGQHQQRNIALAITAALELRNILEPAKSPTDPAPRTADPRVPHPEQNRDPQTARVSQVGVESEGWDTQPSPSGSIVIPTEAKRSGGICFSPAPQPPRVPHPTEGRVGLFRRSEAPYIRNLSSYNLDAHSIAAGIRQTRWPGRLEHLTRGNQHILLDVGHNPAGAWTLRAALAAEAHPPRVILFGCLDDKPVEELAQILFPLFDRVLLVPVPSPRAASGARLLAAAQYVTATATIQPDLATALAAVAGEDAVITGSVYLVGEARGLLMAEGWASDAG